MPEKTDLRTEGVSSSFKFMVFLENFSTNIQTLLDQLEPFGFRHFESIIRLIVTKLADYKSDTSIGCKSFRRFLVGGRSFIIEYVWEQAHTFLSFSLSLFLSLSLSLSLWLQCNHWQNTSGLCSGRLRCNSSCFSCCERVPNLWEMISLLHKNAMWVMVSAVTAEVHVILKW